MKQKCLQKYEFMQFDEMELKICILKPKTLKRAILCKIKLCFVFTSLDLDLLPDFIYDLEHAIKLRHSILSAYVVCFPKHIVMRPVHLNYTS